MLKPIKMATYEFKGEESISEWQAEIEEICIQMFCATDKQGLPILVDANPMIKGFSDACHQIRSSMNNDKGSGALLLPGAPREQDNGN